jgi:hypothetical protein
MKCENKNNGLYFIKQKELCLFMVMVVRKIGAQKEETSLFELSVLYRPYFFLRSVSQETLEEVGIASPQTEIRTHDLFNTKQQCPFRHIVGLGGRWNVRIFKLWRVSKVCRMEPIQKRSLILMLEA